MKKITAFTLTFLFCAKAFASTALNVPDTIHLAGHFTQSTVSKITPETSVLLFSDDPKDATYSFIRLVTNSNLIAPNRIPKGIVTDIDQFENMHIQSFRSVSDINKILSYTEISNLRNLLDDLLEDPNFLPDANENFDFKIALIKVLISSENDFKASSVSLPNSLNLIFTKLLEDFYDENFIFDEDKIKSFKGILSLLINKYIADFVLMDEITEIINYYIQDDTVKSMDYIINYSHLPFKKRKLSF
jgi:hypothetical protein